MTPIVRRILTLTAVLVAAVATGCGGGSDTDSTATSSTPAKVTVVLEWTPNTNHSGVYLAKERGIYQRHGLDVTVIEPDASGALAQVVSGNAQFGFSNAEQIIPLRAQGTEIRSIATVMRTNTSSLMAPADRNIRRPRDLEGKRYGTYGGEIERPLVEALVRCDGGDPSKVEFVEVGNVDYSVGFRRGQYDAVWVFDGWDVIRMREIQRAPVTTIAFRDHLDCIPDWYTPVIAAADELIERDPDLVRRFTAATAEGYAIAKDDPAAAAAAVKTAAPESDVRLLTPSARFIARYLVDDGGRWGHQDPAVWDAFNAFLTRSGLPSLDDPTQAYSNDMLPTE